MHDTPIPPPIIDVKNLRVTRQGRDVLHGLNLRLTERRIGMVGRNGSGKSTLARCLCGLQEKSAGTVTIAGVDVAKDRRGALDAVGILFQNPDHQIIFPTVIEEISFGLRQQGQGKADAARTALDWLKDFQRTHWADRSVATLSQGQRHLVCLISVLAMRPKAILLDEPFAGLDIPTTQQLQAILADLEQTLIHITHDETTLAGYDRVIWLESGAVHMDGSPNQVLPAYLDTMTNPGAFDAFADIAD